MRRLKSAYIVLFALVLALFLMPQTVLAGEEDSDTSSSQALAAGEADLSDDGDDAQEANPVVSYKAYVGSKWTSGWKKQGAALGSANKKFQMLKVKVNGDGLSGDVKYRVYSKHVGWRKWVSNGEAIGQKSWVMRGVQLKLTGQLAKQFDIVYRVSLKDTGWQPWVVNGGTSGSTGSLSEVMKLQVKLVRKGSTVSLADGAYYITIARNQDGALQVPGSKKKANVQMSKAAFKPRGVNERFYLRDEGDGAVSIQSCSSGLFLCDFGGKVVQRADSGAARFRWTLSACKGGIAIINVATGKKLAFSGNKAVTASKGARFWFTETDILPDGLYLISLSSTGTLLAVKGESLDNGAKLVVQDSQDSRSEVFKFKRTGTNTYRIINFLSEKRIEVKDGSANEGAVVCQNASSAKALQKWVVTLERDGTFAFTNKASGNVLSSAGKGKDGASVQSRVDIGAATQRWKLTSISKTEASAFGPEPTPEEAAEARATSLAKSAVSSTNYFITVDLTNHWVCIFKGAKGSRTLYKSWICSTGAPGHETPTGDYTIGYRQYSFGSGYTVYYATAFIGTLYLFHSIKYDEGTFHVQDGRLGVSVSEGCVRLALANAKWIYNNIPNGTKVKIYY